MYIEYDLSCSKSLQKTDDELYFLSNRHLYLTIKFRYHHTIVLLFYRDACFFYTMVVRDF